MTITRKFQGVWIPAETWLDRGLSLTEKVMLVEISSLQDEERGCYASNAHFAEFFDLSISRVSEIISSLAKKGLVQIEQIRDGKRIVERRIRIADPFEKPNTPSENAANPFGKGDEPPSENTKGNNTNNNNTQSNTSSDVVGDAFELYWKAGTKQGSKKKAASIFASIVKRDKRNPMEFAALLINDVNARIGKQYGFDKLHATTYLNQERWNDTLPSANAAPGRTAPRQNFQDFHYENSPDDQFADFTQQ